MSKDFLHYYSLEMRHLREMCGEFVEQHPKIAGRIGLTDFSCEDPYVERLLQGYSFISAKAHQALDAGYPKFSNALLGNFYQDFLMPIPSTGIVKLNPNYENDFSPEGRIVKKGTGLKTSKDDGAECHFRTTHDVKMWPIDIVSVKYYPDDVSSLGLNRSDLCQSCLKLELTTRKDVKFKDFDMENFEFYLADSGITMELYEMLMSSCSQVILEPKGGGVRKTIYNTRNDLLTVRGFDQEDSLFPLSSQTFEGYRLFRKYFVLPQSFMFIQINRIKRAMMDMDSNKVNLMFVFDRENHKLKGKVKKSNFDLFCTPIVNLFEKTFPTINLGSNLSDIDIIKSGSSSESVEIIKVLEVNGIAAKDSKFQPLSPLYSSDILKEISANKVYYSLSCSPKTLTEEENESDTNYVGTHTSVSLVGQNEKAYKGKLEQLTVMALCSNRGLPPTMASKKEKVNFVADSNVGMDNIQLLYGPTEPYCDHLLIPLWEIINHISLNYLTLYDKDDTKIAEIIKSILEMYTVSEMQKKYIEGIKSIKTSRKQQRFNNRGDFSFVNGMSIDLLFDGQKTNYYYFLLGMIIERFFMHATPVDTFTQITISTEKRGKVVKWPVRRGIRPLI